MGAVRLRYETQLDGYIKRDVYMRAQTYFQYTKKKAIELPSADDRWINFVGSRNPSKFDYDLMTFEDEMPKWLREEEELLREDNSFNDRLRTGPLASPLGCVTFPMHGSYG